MLSTKPGSIIASLFLLFLGIIIWGLHARISNLENRVSAIAEQRPDENVSKKTLDSLSDGSYRLVPSENFVPTPSKNGLDMSTYGLYKADSSKESGWKLIRVFGDTAFTGINENKEDLKPEIWIMQSHGRQPMERLNMKRSSERETEKWKAVEVRLDSPGFSIDEFYDIHLIE